MSSALVIAITRAERDWLLRLIRYSDEYIAGREPAQSLLEMLESGAMTAEDTRRVFGELAGEQPI